MLELLILCIFSIGLIICLATNASILYALCFGFILFFFYGIYKKNTIVDMLKMSFSGILTVKNVLITFILIGIITAVWRASGTIAFIVYYCSKICTPKIMLLITFILCCLVSALTGTAFGTSATIGVICITMANSMGIPILYTGGAILAGSYFGDRCSPMSCSAILVSTLTKTNIFHNITNMIKTSIVPFLLSCVFYIAVGLFIKTGNINLSTREIFAEQFNLHFTVLIPAIVIVILSLFKVNVKITMSFSIIIGIIVSLIIQKVSALEMIRIIVLGYCPSNQELARLLTGGGITSMLKVFIIVCLSSCYAGIFNGTGFLNDIKKVLYRISTKITAYGGIMLTSVFTSIIACSQTLSIMLTYQICDGIEKDSERMASYLEDTVVIISALVPWSISCAVPFSSISAPNVCVFTACYLYFVPLWNLFVNLKRKKLEKSRVA